MSIKYADDIIKEINNRGTIQIPENSATGEEFEKWLYEDNMDDKEIKSEEHMIDARTKCKYCEGGQPLVTGNTNDAGIVIIYPYKLNAYGYNVHGYDSNGISININYCPMCGKSLRNISSSDMLDIAKVDRPVNRKELGITDSDRNDGLVAHTEG